MMNEQEQPLEDTMMEVRDDFMLSPAGDSKQTLRTAHFLKPIANTIHERPPLKFKTSSSSSVFDPNEWPLKINFTGWRQRYNQEKWVSWVEDLKLKYESVWKKAGIFEAIMSTKCHIVKNEDLLCGVVEKWCCKTNTFVFRFGEATITLEDVMVLGGYPIIGHPVFTKVKDQEMKEVEEKLIIARQKPSQIKKCKATTSIWMDMFIDSGNEIEHEAFLATWLSIFVFPRNYLVRSSLFPIVVHLARGNPIALAPTVLARIYRDLSLFKETIVDLSKFPVGSDRYPLEITLPSPFYLVQIWVWERFKNLQPQPMLIDHRDPIMLRWHKVDDDSKVDNVRLALDSAMDDFLWRPYVRYADKCGLYYPNDETIVPFKKDLDKQMLSFVICLRVSELVGFESIEQYLPHRVAMQFGFDQDVPSYVPRFNETKFIAWKNYCRPILDQNLYFPSRFFEGDVTARYAKWWQQPVLDHGDFVKNIVKRKRSESSRKHRPHVGKANRSVPPGFRPHLVDILCFEKFCYDYPAENSAHDHPPSISVEDCTPVLKTKHLTNQCSSASLADFVLSTRSLEEDFEDVRKKATMSSDRICLSKTQGESKIYKRYSLRKKISSSNNENVMQQDIQFHSDMAAQSEAKETVEEKGSKESDHEVVVFLKEQCLKNQEELGRLARQQEEILRIMESREKRDEELRQLLTSFLRNQQPTSSS